MKTIFVVNPVSGKHAGENVLVRQIREHAINRHQDVTIYQTQGERDAESFIFRTVLEEAGEPLKIIVCGGDGTMNEAVNGLMKAKNTLLLKDPKAQVNAALGLVPIGSGNDFIKNFWSVEAARSIDAQLTAKPVDCDVLEYTRIREGAEPEVRYCANMFNIGFDCNTADLANRIKKSPLVSGSMAYLLSVLINLIKKKGADLKVSVDGETIHEGPLLLCSIANGPYCGGGIKSNPTATVQDGKIDVNVVQDVSHLQFLKLLPSYMKGTHMQMKGVEKIIRTAVCEEVEITPLNGSMRLCTDGEITDEEIIRVRVIRGGYKFLAP